MNIIMNKQKLEALIQRAYYDGIFHGCENGNNNGYKNGGTTGALNISEEYAKSMVEMQIQFSIVDLRDIRVE